MVVWDTLLMLFVLVSWIAAGYDNNSSWHRDKDQKRPWKRQNGG
jgi:hypothetical protein